MSFRTSRCDFHFFLPLFSRSRGKRDYKNLVRRKNEISPLATMIHSNPRIVPAFLLNISIGGLRCGEGKDAGDEDSSAQEIILWYGRG